MESTGIQYISCDYWRSRKSLLGTLVVLFGSPQPIGIKNLMGVAVSKEMRCKVVRVLLVLLTAGVVSFSTYTHIFLFFLLVFWS